MTEKRKERKRFKTRWKLVVAYDGTDYSGWQVQPERRTIQQTLADAIQSVTGERVLPQGSGRTDAGVHAFGQVASIGLYADIPEDNLLRALNRILPGSIRVMEARPMHPKFHARGKVLSKTYIYRIFLRRPKADMTERICPPERARYLWDCPLRLDVEAMQAAAQIVAGEHDFTSFAAFDPDRSARIAKQDENGPDNIRTIFRSEWVRANDELTYTVSGNGFLHHMVRNLVGTFVAVGEGRFSVDDVKEILAAKDRGRAGATAPPQGLALLEVIYDETPSRHGAQP
ncbi:MAG: tRNA pseudouridine(38-40) synthase TruA [Acidobacteria bacterium]|nr:tRNA pseudouridine(38-40) synthase TruA [Acidobacteriota bacterium]